MPVIADLSAHPTHFMICCNHLHTLSAVHHRLWAGQEIPRHKNQNAHHVSGGQEPDWHSQICQCQCSPRNRTVVSPALFLLPHPPTQSASPPRAPLTPHHHPNVHPHTSHLHLSHLTLNLVSHTFPPPILSPTTLLLLPQAPG